MGYYAAREIYPWLHSIRDPQGVFCYLAVGAERALLFDAAYGVGSLPDAVREITDKPFDVVLGHGHLDHAMGAYQFDEVWLHESDFGLCEEHCSEEFRKMNLGDLAAKGAPLPEGFDADAYAKAGAGRLKKMETGRVFDLGGLSMEVVGMEGHTAGSVGLLARERRVLLDSDSASNHVWMFLEESLPLSEYAAMLERVAALGFDTFFGGHFDDPRPKSDFEKYIRAAREAPAGESTPYPQFPWLKGWLYRGDGADIVFNKDRL